MIKFSKKKTDFSDALEIVEFRDRNVCVEKQQREQIVASSELL